MGCRALLSDDRVIGFTFSLVETMIDCPLYIHDNSLFPFLGEAKMAADSELRKYMKGVKPFCDAEYFIKLTRCSNKFVNPFNGLCP